MKRFFLIMFLITITTISYGQKVLVTVVSNNQAGKTEWQILDENYIQVYKGSEAMPGDSAFIPLEADRHYILQLSVLAVYRKDQTISTIVVEGEPVLKVPPTIDPGDYFYPFAAGTRKEISKIIGGSTAVISQYPWQIFLVSGSYMCGGSIINKDWVITAAHCVQGISASSMRIIAGTSTPYSFGTRYNVSQVYVHPGYSSTTLDDDIALLRTSSSIACTNCTPIKLVTSEVADEGYTVPGVMTTISGWGLTSVSPEVSPTNLMVAQIPIISDATALSVWQTIPGTNIMAGYANGNKDACSGDSGGPMSVSVWGEPRLAGIVSWGSKNCDTYGGYTRVSLFDYWIKNITGVLVASPTVPYGDSIVCPANITSVYTTGTFAGATSYEWQVYPAEAGTIAPEGTSATVTWNKAYVGAVKIRVRAIVGTQYTEWATRSVQCGLATILISEPVDATTCEGTNIDLKMNIQGTLLNFNWYKDGAVYQMSGGSHMYFYEPVPSNSGNYQVKVTGLCGNYNSNVFNLTVYPITAISSVSPDVTAHYGDNITLDVSASGHNLSYLWKKNGASIDNSNVPEISLLNVDARDIGVYSSIVRGTCGTLYSDSIYVYLRHTDVYNGVELTVWPTVVTSNLNIALAGSEKYELRFVNISGKVMLITSERQYQSSVDMSDFPKGIYILTIKGKTFSRTYKIFRQ
jgi:secreted trypsin-like serine protease